jgi:hypothetical protein
VDDWPTEYGYRDYKDQLTLMPFWRAKIRRRRWWHLVIVSSREW